MNKKGKIRNGYLNFGFLLFINFNFRMTCAVEIDLLNPLKKTRSAISGNSAFDLKYRVSRYFRMNICYFEEFRILLKISEETNKDIKRSLISFIKGGVPIFFPINLILMNMYMSFKDIYHICSNKLWASNNCRL